MKFITRSVSIAFIFFLTINLGVAGTSIVKEDMPSYEIETQLSSDVHEIYLYGSAELEEVYDACAFLGYAAAGFVLNEGGTVEDAQVAFILVSTLCYVGGIF